MNDKTKGIVLAGGSGSRLYPLTLAISKQLLPVYSKPMIYYPLSILMLAGIREVAIITTPHDQAQFKTLLGDGSQYGIEITYVVQPSPGGLAQAFLLTEDFLDNSPCALVLGDNVFYGGYLRQLVQEAQSRSTGATVFAYQVENPQDYGVICLDDNKRPVSIEEKPTHPKSNLAVTGLYFYDSTVVQRAKSLTPSARGELEITDLNKSYLADGELYVSNLGRGFAWLDTGTYESLLQASNFVEAVEKRQGLMIACLEEVALRNGWLSKSDIEATAAKMQNTQYGKYLSKIIAGDQF